MMYEFENKYPLCAEEYSYLLRQALGTLSTTRQTNYYFDTPDLCFHRRGITCRIREKGGKYIATIKEHYENGGNLERSEIAFGEWDTRFFYGLGVSLCGTLHTTRSVIYKDDYCTVMLDKNSYLDVIDYEMEVEYVPGHQSDCEHAVVRIAEHLTKFFAEDTLSDFLARRKEAKSKSARFFERLTEMQGGDLHDFHT